MSQFSNYLENALINATLRNTSYTSPATVYCALYTSNPDEDNSGTEVSGNNYARVSVTFGAPSNGVSTNSADLVFPTSSGSWGTVTHFSIMDASTSGNMLYYGSLNSSAVIDGADYILTISSGDLSITLA
jgi:hypothetical protein